MSTKSTISHSPSYHLYQELGESERIYLQIDKHEGYFCLEGQRLTLSITPELLTEIATAWLKHKDSFESNAEEIDSEAILSFFKELV